MKNFKKFLIIALIFFFGLLGISKADVIPENSHRFDKCVKIENPDEFPGYKLIIWINSVMKSKLSDSVYQVEKDTCLKQHYMGTSTPYLVKQDLDIQEINKLFDEYQEDSTIFEQYLGNNFIKFESINPNGGYVSNFSKKTYENITYKLIYDNNEYRLIKIQTESDENLINTVYYTIWPKGVSFPSKYYRIIKFVISWIITVVLETIMLFFLCKMFFKKNNLKNGRIILTGILASSITLPILRFILPHFFHNYTIYAIIGEVFVTFVEIFIIKYILDINRQKSTIASIACNLFSVIIGLLL